MERARVLRLKDWLSKVFSREDIKEIFEQSKIFWYNVLQLESWTKNWVKQHGKCRQLTKFEGLIIQLKRNGTK